MKNFEMLNNQVIISNIPFVYDGRELSSKLQAKLMLMRVSYNKSVAAFEDKINEALKGFKPEGFDDLSRDVERMRYIESKVKDCKEWCGSGDKPSEPTAEELEESAKIRAEKLTDYESKEKVLIEKWKELRIQELEEECPHNIRKITEDEYAEIIEVIKTEGEIEYNFNGRKNKIEKTQFLELIAAGLVD